MAVTKITVSTAMRARDVSRPQAQHFAEAAGREAAATRPPEPELRPASPPPAQASPPDPAQVPPRRRRRRGR
jgi:hypothetical protein